MYNFYSFLRKRVFQIKIIFGIDTFLCSGCVSFTLPSSFLKLKNMNSIAILFQKRMRNYNLYIK